MNLGALIQQAVNSAGTPALAQAAEQHVAAMPSEELSEHLQTAAGNASANGNPGLAGELLAMIEQHHMNPEALKDAVISYIQANPQVLEHFAPAFAQNLLQRL